MKYFKTYESFLNEAKLSKVFKAAKKGSYPATIVVIKNKKVIHQEQVNTPEAIPAAFNVIQKKYPKSIVTVEDSTGATLYREVDEKKAYMKKIDLKDFKSIKKGSKVKYMGGDAEVLDNTGFILKLKGEDGKTFTVNKSMFDHGGMISEGIAQMAKKAYMDLKKHFKKSVFSSGPSKLFNIVEPSDSDYEYAADWVKKNGAKGDKIYMSGTDEILNKIHIAYGQPNLDIQSKDIAEVSIDRPTVNEAANVPSNIEKFAKERGVLRDVKQIARWAEKAGKRIVGGTAIGKGYDTLVLDLTYQGAEVYFDTYKGTIKVNNQPVDSWKTFSKAINESASSKDGGDKSNGNSHHEDHIKKGIEELWKDTYGEKFSSKYPGIAKILKQRNVKDKRELKRIWDETYGENFEEQYPGIWGKLD